METDPDGRQGKLLVTYAHFSDIMPEVHRGYYTVFCNGDHDFSLSHASPEFARAEAEDILLSELGSGFQVSQVPFAPHFFDRISNTRPGTLSAEAIVAIKALVSHFNTAIFDVPFLDDAGLHAAIGVTHWQSTDSEQHWLAWQYSLPAWPKRMDDAFLEALKISPRSKSGFTG
jgi:hypothetical protein